MNDKRHYSVRPVSGHKIADARVTSGRLSKEIQHQYPTGSSFRQPSAIIATLYPAVLSKGRNMNGINSKHQLDFTCFSQNNTHAIRMQFRMIPPVHIVSRSLIVALAALGASLTFAKHAGAADSGKIVIQVDKPGARISPMFYGLMTEEINYSYDGG